ncbi:hypothetical protein BV898_14283 [Hypsibius exemplaris]|uniref:Ig-like and fibronectin type-III domain-containing protein C25G4.10 n=1 Tax=Hypsibius exemplaris TaxID=2072580 RepID=A0A1W0W873_HYPEX|nr:hypothetical protein BV898_14283 [Hypsibius exemplaris]
MGRASCFVLSVRFFICWFPAALWLDPIQGLPILQMDVSSPVVAIVGSDVKLSCSAMQWTATEGYTITWSKNNTGEVLSKNLHVVADPAKYAVTTVTSSELESTTWTLTVKDASQTDGGDYTCSLKTEPPQFFTLPVIMQTPVISDIPSEVIRWDVSECCQAKGIPPQCLPLCNTMTTGFNVYETLRVSDQCRPYHDAWFRCLASERNHTPCCKRRHVPDKCQDLCLGNFSTVFREGNLQCLHFVGVIFKCFHDGRDSIPSPPRNLRVAPVGTDSLRVSWSPPLKHGKELNYTVFYKTNAVSGSGGSGGKIKAVSTVALGLILTSLQPGEVYVVNVVALNVAGSSQSSDVVTVEVPKPVGRLVDGSLSDESAQISERLLLASTQSPLKPSPVTLLAVTLKRRLPSTITTTPETGVDNLFTISHNQNQLPDIPAKTLLPQDDFTAFDRCFTGDFRSSCSEVLKVNGGRHGKNATIVRCRDSLPRFINCAANDSDHRKCCSRNAISDRCLDYCAGRPTGMFTAACHVFLPRILSCFRESAIFLSSEPIDVSADFREAGQISIQWRPPEVNVEMVEQYVVTMEDRKSGVLFNVVVPKENHSALIDPTSFHNEFVIYVQAENFHGLSRKSAAVSVNLDEISNNFQQNVQPPVGDGVGPTVAIGISLTGIGIVLIVVGAAYWQRRRRHAMPDSTGHSVCTSVEQLAESDKLGKPMNAFYIPGYFGRRGIVSQKSSTGSSGSYATSFSVRQHSPTTSGLSDPVYSDVSGAYLWMFGRDKKAATLQAQAKQIAQRPSCSRKSSGMSEPNIYDNNLPH